MCQVSNTFSLTRFASLLVLQKGVSPLVTAPLRIQTAFEMRYHFGAVIVQQRIVDDEGTDDLAPVNERVAKAGQDKVGVAGHRSDNIVAVDVPVSGSASVAVRSLQGISSSINTLRSRVHARASEDRQQYYKTVPRIANLAVVVPALVVALFVMIRLAAWGTCDGTEWAQSSVCLVPTFPVFQAGEAHVVAAPHPPTHIRLPCLHNHILTRVTFPRLHTKRSVFILTISSGIHDVPHVFAHLLRLLASFPRLFRHRHPVRMRYDILRRAGQLAVILHKRKSGEGAKDIRIDGKAVSTCLDTHGKARVQRECTCNEYIAFEYGACPPIDSSERAWVRYLRGKQ